MTNKISNLQIPKISLFITTFLIPFYFLRFDLLNIPTNIFEIAVLVSLLLSTAYYLLSDRRLVAGPFWLYLLIIFAAVGVFVASDRTAALGILKGWFVVPAIFYLLVINTFDKENIKQLSIPLLISVVAISLWAIMQKLGIITTLFYQTTDPSFDQYLGSNFRVFGPFESPNYLAMFLVPATFLSISAFNYCKRGFAKFALALVYILPVIALVLSGSRGGAIAAFVAFIISICVIARKKSLGTGILIYLLSFVLIAVLILAIKLIGFDPSSDSIRIQIYQYSWQILKENWLMGIGLGEFQNNIAGLSVDAISFKTHALPYALHPHNIYLAMAIYLGVGGFVSFIATSIWFFVKAWGARAHSFVLAGAVSAFSAILVHGFVDTTYYKNDLSVLFWLILAVMVVISSKDEQKQGDSKPVNQLDS